MEIFKLDSDANSYQSIAPTTEAGFELLRWLDGSPRLSSWIPLEARIVDPQLPAGDFPAFRPAVPVFGSKAVADLADLLEQNGELLPLSCTNGQYYAYNVTAVADVLEEAKSEIRRFRTGRILDIVRYEFRQNVLIPPIFKLPQVPTLWVYVTDQFVARAKSAGLCGIRFRQVWASQS